MCDDASSDQEVVLLTGGRQGISKKPALSWEIHSGFITSTSPPCKHILAELQSLLQSQLCGEALFAKHEGISKKRPECHCDGCFLMRRLNRQFVLYELLVL